VAAEDGALGRAAGRKVFKFGGGGGYLRDGTEGFPCVPFGFLDKVEHSGFGCGARPFCGLGGRSEVVVVVVVVVINDGGGRWNLKKIFAHNAKKQRTMAHSNDKSSHENLLFYVIHFVTVDAVRCFNVRRPG